MPKGLTRHFFSVPSVFLNFFAKPLQFTDTPKTYNLNGLHVLKIFKNRIEVQTTVITMYRPHLTLTLYQHIFQSSECVFFKKVELRYLDAKCTSHQQMNEKCLGKKIVPSTNPCKSKLHGKMIKKSFNKVGYGVGQDWFQSLGMYRQKCEFWTYTAFKTWTPPKKEPKESPGVDS